MALPHIDAESLAELLPMATAIDALESAFGKERPPTPLRSHVEVPNGTLLLMPSYGPEGVGIKLITINPDNPARGQPLIQGEYVLFSPDTLAPEAFIDGAALTAIRTAAVSGVATRHLARLDADHLVIFGAGTQAHSHLDAMLAVRRIASIVVVSRTAARADELVERARDKGLEASTGDSDAVRDAGIVCCCTTSPDPLFDGAALAAGAHVNAVGSYQPHTREIDEETVRRAGRVVVESRTAALEEAGDVVIPIRSGALAEGSLVELGEVVRGERVRADAGAVTVFKSVGVAFEDLVVARAAANGVA